MWIGHENNHERPYQHSVNAAKIPTLATISSITSGQSSTSIPSGYRHHFFRLCFTHTLMTYYVDSLIQKDNAEWNETILLLEPDHSLTVPLGGFDQFVPGEVGHDPE